MPSPPRPIAYDVTHIAAGLVRARSSGIDKVDQAYAQRMVDDFNTTLVHYGLFKPRCHPSSDLANLLAHSLDVPPQQGLETVTRWLSGAAQTADNAPGLSTAPAPPAPAIVPEPWPRKARRRATQLHWLLNPGHGDVPAQAIYLNVAQHLFEMPRYFSWLEKRPDVRSVFLVHDLLPLDWPEYFRPGYHELFGRRWSTIERHAHALLTTTTAVRQRIEEQLESEGKRQRPIHVEPLPSPLPEGRADDRLAAIPYFIVVGTIEPRKNHLLLLNIWRRLAEEMAAPPKLVIVGKRGWENEQIVDVLDRGALTRPHVLEVSNLGEDALATLIRNARGLLCPSFAEGYGLPLTEALTLRVPVVASDIPVFREVGQGRAIYCHPLDGLAWRRAILGLSDPHATLAREARAAAQAFEQPTWDRYFANVEAFIRGL